MLSSYHSTIYLLINNLKLEQFLTDIKIERHDSGYSKQKVLYGTKNGTIGLVDLLINEGIILFEIETQSSSVINTLHFFQIIENTGLPNLILGKVDGLIEVYSIDEADTLTFQQSYQCDESVTGLQGAYFSSLTHGEIIVCTYSGWVFGLTTRLKFDNDSSNNKALPSSINNDENAPKIETKVQKLKKEVDYLENQLRNERDRYQLNVLKQQSLNDNSNVGVNITPFTINDKFLLRKDLGCYTLAIELTIPIDYVLLQSDVKVNLMDVERNSAVVSLTQTEAQSGNALLAVYRCQADIARMEMRIQSIEGQFGTLKIYIVPRFVPIMCQTRSYLIKPLALHECIHNFDNMNRPLNVLTFTGNFTISEAHSWFVLCTSQIPERCPQEDTVTFNFQSTFNGGTILQATYSKGNATYRTDNLSTIVILRDVICKIVTMRQLKVHISCDVNNESIIHMIRLIYPKIEHHLILVKKLKLAKGLKELEATFEDTSYLSFELKELLKNYEQLDKEVNNQTLQFERLLGTITDLYIDKYKVIGQNVKHRVNELLSLLNDNCTLENLIEFFNTKPVKQ